MSARQATAGREAFSARPALARLLTYYVDYTTFHELRLHILKVFLTGFCKLALCFPNK
jgi:hypothetical protein